MATAKVSQSDRVRAHRLRDEPEYPAVVPLYYHGITPIATCHWQWVGNILAARGVRNAWEMLGLSWGCRWMGGSVLFGLATWPRLLQAISGTDVAILTFEGAAQARAAELQLSLECVPFIAEIDAYSIPADNRERTHIVHAVLVINRDEDRAHIVDSTISADVMERSNNEWELMRASPCVGRVECHKLYSVGWAPTIEPEPAGILQVVRAHLTATFPESLRVLERYIEWAERSDEPIDVCRAAGERYQATRLFEYLAQQKIEAAIRPATLLSQLTNDWYLVHMLATHESALQDRARRRIVRLLKRLAVNEVELAEAVLG
jgi:hypothetical protein